MPRPARRPLRVWLLPAALALATACASFRPAPLEEVPFRDRQLTETREGLTVTVAVPTNAEARRIFGVDLASRGIQPVWIRIENTNDDDFYFMHHGLDPHYFSAHEAAYKSHLTLRPITNTEIDEHFDRLALWSVIPRFGSTEGFAFSNLKMGTKEVRVRIFGERKVVDFSFFVTVPGFQADWHSVEFDSIYDESEIVDLATEAELEAKLMELPCCTTRKDGSGQGDPLNIVVISAPSDDDEDMGLLGFLRAGWDETELLTFGSAWKTFKAFFGGEYKYSPMSALYVFGRPQDIGLQKARETIHERNHLRLWLAPWTYQGRRVWVGGISRDIGVYLTTRAWNLTTHAIDPDIDESRNYLTEDLATAEALERAGRLPGVGRATRENPHRNLMNAPWWTDGYREVYLLSEQPTPLVELDFWSWEDRAREAGQRMREAAD